MQLDELKRKMSALDQILGSSKIDIKINVKASTNAQDKILRKYFQAFTSSAILAAVFAVLLIAGVNADTFPLHMQTFLVIYLGVAALWYAFLYFRLRSISVPTLLPAQLFKKVAMLKILTLSGEIVLGIGLAVFFTLLISERIISGTVVLALFFATLAFALAFGVLFLWPEYIRLFRSLTSVVTDSTTDQSESNMVYIKPLELKWITGIAAVVIVLVSVAVYNPFRATGATLPASQLVVEAMDTINTAGEHRVDFTIRATRSDDEEAYKANFDAEMIDGTLYLSSVPGDEQIRVEFDDPEKTTLTQSVRLSNLLDLNSVVREFKDKKDYVFEEKGDSVIVTTTNGSKGNGLLKLKAIFSRKECRLKSVVVTAEKDGQEKTMLQTRKIDYR